jgi:hypothetical protein
LDSFQALRQGKAQESGIKDRAIFLFQRVAPNEFVLLQMYFHGDDMKKLHKFIPSENLPKNYGGKLPEIDYTGRDWYPCVEKHQQYVTEWAAFGFK